MKITILVDKLDLEKLNSLIQGFPVDGNIRWYHANGNELGAYALITIAYNDYVRLVDHNYHNMTM